jgi:uncharacterized protein DUF4153
MQSNPNRLWIAVIVLGFVFDFLFWNHVPGIAFAIYVGLVLAVGFLLLGLDHIRAGAATLALLAPIALFSLITFNRAEPFTLFTAYAFTLFLMALLAVTFVSGRWPAFGIADYVVNLAKALGNLLAQPIIFRGQTKESAPEPEAGAERPSWRVWAVVRGLLIALPIVVVFAALLSSADLVFADRLQNVVRAFRLERLPEYLWRLFYILVIAYALAGTYLHAARKSAATTLVGSDKAFFKPFLGFTEAAIVLGSVIALFAAFVVIQVQYFFGGQANIGLQGYTYAEYARRGFGELVAVAFFSLLLFLGLSAITRREAARQHTVFAGLSVALAALVGVILLSAYDRLLLYEAAYGFTRLRTYTHLFLIWVGVLLVVVVLLDVFKRQRVFTFAALLAAVGFAASLGLLNVDGFIASHNIQRGQAGYELDAGYLAELSADAVPVMVSYYRSPDLDRATHAAVGAALACINAREGFPYQPAAWQSLSLSPWRASRAIMPVLKKITATYTVRDNSAISPSEGLYPCYSSYGD